MTKSSKCVMSYCGHRQQRDKACIYAKFPKNIERCRKWLKVVGDSDLVYLPPVKLNEIRYVCGCHFTDDQFCNSTHKRLKKTAVPTLIDARIIPLTDDLVNQYPLPLDIPRIPAISLQKVTLITNRHATNTSTKKILSTSEYRYNRNENDLPPISTSEPIPDTLLINTNVVYTTKSLDTKSLRMSGLSPVGDEGSCVNRTTLRTSPRGSKAGSKDLIVGTSRRRPYCTINTPLSSPSKSNKIQRISVKDSDRVPEKTKENYEQNVLAKSMSTDPAESRVSQHISKYDEFGLYVVQCLKKMNPVLADNVVLKMKKILNDCNN